MHGRADRRDLIAQIVSAKRLSSGTK
jgi:hypothetical protein